MKGVTSNILKVDESEGLVYGFAVVCTEDGEPYYDLQGDHIEEAEMRKAATDFMVTERQARDMHGESNRGKVIHSMPFTQELAEALGIEDTIRKSGWIVAIKPDDDAILKKYKSGEYTGFSIGGKAKRVEVEDE